MAVDVSAEGNGRVAMIMHDQQVRDAYSSFPSFLRDLIRANESNELLACLQTPGPVLELKALVPAEPPQPRAARNSPALPVGDKALVVRTDFSDDAAWVALRAKLQHAEADSAADVEFVDDRALAGVTAEQFRSLLPPGRHVSFGFLADRAAMAEPDHPILAVGLSKRKSKTFRVAAAALGEVEGNLSLGNMDFAEFLKALDADGVFRGAASESGPQ